MFGTEKVICPKNSGGGWSGFVTALVWIDPNSFGSLCANPNKIQTNDMVGGVMYFCRQCSDNLDKNIGASALTKEPTVLIFFEMSTK